MTVCKLGWKGSLACADKSLYIWQVLDIQSVGAFCCSGPSILPLMDSSRGGDRAKGHE